ncbi:hypothetical protein DV451_004404 [Geotrichum candidum]|uniref:Altered inheritance rate of mitochondria protein 29 n=1 Tax=Geotrichum candidum TaxID=1173061 RepID=A0A0J9XLG5_GEOCN|nr:hypothetical protein DV451_004404 [Geotrichum candidum]KAF5109906.1 hypothetical protein DV453_001197 [Geotrichum candidum]KAF5113049.1 hypothetical protein DV452_003803 [Geotrichum candidum]KAF5117939.1 hypothetical protein DV454_000832 [Geotrichum candidum]KAF5136132.1 hypothetical protein DV495_000203 [Geotrichum candidum]
MSAPVDYDQNEPLTSTLRPQTNAILTIRIIKSFPYRSIKNHVLKDVDLVNTTAGDLLEQIKTLIKTTSALRPYRTTEFDTLKIYTKAHGSKTMNLVINFEHDDDWIMSDLSRTLADYGVENETEISVFNREAYEEFKKNPEEKW